MIVELPKELTVSSAIEVKEALLAALGGHARVEIDARAVVDVDVAGLQLLCAAHRSAVALGRSLAFTQAGRGAALEAALSGAGLLRHQGCRSGCLLEEPRHG